jgi:hypothetical protein
VVAFVRGALEQGAVVVYSQDNPPEMLSSGGFFILLDLKTMRRIAAGHLKWRCKIRCHAGAAASRRHVQTAVRPRSSE